jgi:myosin heavy subunit
VELFEGAAATDSPFPPAPGLLEMIDAANADLKLGATINRSHAGHSHFKAFPDRLMRNAKFIVAHYAGDVTYSTFGCVEKNGEALLPALSAALAGCKNRLVARLFGTAGDAASSDAELSTASTSTSTSRSAPTAATSKSVGGRFKEDLHGLFAEVTATEKTYVACVRPNDAKSHELFSNTVVVEQLRAMGTAAAARIAKASYPHRMDHMTLVQRFAGLPNGAEALAATCGDRKDDVATGFAELAPDAARAAVASLLTATVPSFAQPLQYKVGLKATYLRADVLEELERKRNQWLTDNGELEREREKERELERERLAALENAKADTLKVRRKSELDRQEKITGELDKQGEELARLRKEVEEERSRRVAAEKMLTEITPVRSPAPSEDSGQASDDSGFIAEAVAANLALEAVVELELEKEAELPPPMPDNSKEVEELQAKYAQAIADLADEKERVAKLQHLQRGAEVVQDKLSKSHDNMIIELEQTAQMLAELQVQKDADVAAAAAATTAPAPAPPAAASTDTAAILKEMEDMRALMKQQQEEAARAIADLKQAHEEEMRKTTTVLVETKRENTRRSSMHEEDSAKMLQLSMERDQLQHTNEIVELQLEEKTSFAERRMSLEYSSQAQLREELKEAKAELEKVQAQGREELESLRSETDAKVGELNALLLSTDQTDSSKREDYEQEIADLKMALKASETEDATFNKEVQNMQRELTERDERNRKEMEINREALLEAQAKAQLAQALASELQSENATNMLSWRAVIGRIAESDAVAVTEIQRRQAAEQKLSKLEFEVATLRSENLGIRSSASGDRLALLDTAPVPERHETAPAPAPAPAPTSTTPPSAVVAADPARERGPSALFPMKPNETPAYVVGRAHPSSNIAYAGGGVLLFVLFIIVFLFIVIMIGLTCVIIIIFCFLFLFLWFWFCYSFAFWFWFLIFYFLFFFYCSSFFFLTYSYCCNIC